MKVLLTGAAGFIGGYLVEELLQTGHEVVGLDNLSKYGELVRNFDRHQRYRFVRGDAKDTGLVKKLAADCDQIIAAAARIGGISYFHDFAYDLLAENERILASTFDAAVWAFQKKHLKRMIVVSSSMVFENAARFPTREGDERRFPPPSSTYGFQKLATEYFAKGAWEQYKLPYTIVRPFNCVGIGERRCHFEAGGREIPEISPHSVRRNDNRLRLAASHVVPDLVEKALKGQSPLRILGSGRQIRHFTYGGDIARGIRLAMESRRAVNEDFNISTRESTTILELARLIWKKIHGPKKFRYVQEKPFVYDVRKRIPDVRKAKRILGFEAETTLDTMLDEVIAWISAHPSPPTLTLPLQDEGGGKGRGTG